MINHQERKPVTGWRVVYWAVMLLTPLTLGAQAVDPTPPVPAPGSRYIFIDPSSTKVSLGKVSLIVSPLAHVGKCLLGEYQINVVPYFYKNEKGALELDVSEDLEQKLAVGVVVKFIGKAINGKNGKIKIIVGKASAASKESGAVTFSIETENGMMVFNTTYHIKE